MTGHGIFAAFLSVMRVVGGVAIVLIGLIGGSILLKDLQKEPPKPKYLSLSANEYTEVCHQGVAYLLLRTNGGFTVKLDTNSRIVKCDP
jgi:hypothetical protein